MISTEDFINLNLNEKNKYIKEYLNLGEEMLVLGNIEKDFLNGSGIMIAQYYYPNFSKFPLEINQIFTDGQSTDNNFYFTNLRNNNKYNGFNSGDNNIHIFKIEPNFDDKIRERNEYFKAKFISSINLEDAFDDEFPHITNETFKIVSDRFDNELIVQSFKDIAIKLVENEKIMLSEEINKLENKFKEIKEESEKISNENQLKKNTLTELSDKIDETNKDIEQLDIDKNTITDKIKNYKKEIDQKKEELAEINNKLKSFKFTYESNNDNSNSDNSEEDITEIDNFDDYVSDIGFQLHKSGLFFDKNTLVKLLYTLLANELVILTGRSGTGKTSVLIEISKIIGAKYTLIPVQPSWYDKQDLLGFYNPISDEFVSTVFIDTLVEAKNNPNQLYIIILDEINLSKIEYYLADILSTFETKEKTLNLYSDGIYYKRLRERNEMLDVFSNHYENMNDINSSIKDFQTRLEYQNKFSNFDRYPNKLNISSNVRIVGTMNAEGLVEPLSPKVIDRTYIIPVENSNTHENYNFSGREDLRLPFNSLRQLSSEIDNLNSKTEEITSIIEQINKYLTNEITLNHRSTKHMIKYNIINQIFPSENINIIDDLLLMKVFPKIHHVINEENIEELETEINEDLKFSNLSLSKQKLLNMIEKAKSNRILSFWS